jgi:hypothetical protein
MTALPQTIPMHFLRLPAATIQLLCLCATVSCQQQKPDTHVQAIQPAVSLEWKFESAPSEEATVARLMQDLGRVPIHPEDNSVAVLRRFDPAEHPGRYLLMGFLPPEKEGSPRPVAIFVMQDSAGTGEISNPHVIGTDVLGTFGIAGTGDYDGDGKLDVVYCTWADRDEAVGYSHIVTYTGREWLEVNRPSKALPKCDQ